MYNWGSRTGMSAVDQILSHMLSRATVDDVVVDDDSNDADALRIWQQRASHAKTQYPAQQSQGNQRDLAARRLRSRGPLWWDRYLQGFVNAERSGEEVGVALGDGGDSVGKQGCQQVADPAAAMQYGVALGPVVLRGSDIGDIPTEYRVTDLRKGEQPVIGTYVDPRITPGFRYRVRCLGGALWQFDGEPRLLTHVGCGYGKRLSFGCRGDVERFYSDNATAGYAFVVCCLRRGDAFTVHDEVGRAVAAATVVDGDAVGQTEEVSCFADAERVEKRVEVSFSCDLSFAAPRGRLRPLYADAHAIPLRGVATVVKTAREACVVSVTGVVVPLLGRCFLLRE
ncbi:PREDICTED: uncharacterized protein LOC106810056 [Priapulus caudatus]|uniref:Uncharacterized protein LOC106810056 n=1 Tax=Priapulus caudatus TaxID=37621 RepID=A0ABM1E9D6_PRICU|nr:PREDICTED: uncharacterized protein LOC106810056 [Priapulus caudatus]